jgi:hypothetical protein
MPATTGRFMERTPRYADAPCTLERSASRPAGSAAAPCGWESLTNSPGAGPGEAAAGGTPARRFMGRAGVKEVLAFPLSE